MAMRLELSEQSEQQLQEIMMQLQIKTKSKAIAHLISQYSNLQQKLEKATNDNEHYLQQLKVAKAVTKNYVEAKHNLTDFAYGDEWNEELIRRADLMDSGKTKTYTRGEFNQKAAAYIDEIKNR